MTSRREVESALRSSQRVEERLAVFGALLARGTRLGGHLVIVGGSAISILTRGDYVSGDVDIVGPVARIAPVLRRWGFRREIDPDGRPYWSRGDLGLVVDVINRPDYVGLLAGVRSLETPYGPVRVAASEDLIVRRLVFWKRGGARELMDQAVALFVLDRERLDTDYLEAEVRYEGIEDAYGELKKLADGLRQAPPPTVKDRRA